MTIKTVRRSFGIQVFDVLPLGAKIIRFEEFSVTMVIRSALKPESLSRTQREELQI